MTTRASSRLHHAASLGSLPLLGLLCAASAARAQPSATPGATDAAATPAATETAAAAQPGATGTAAADEEPVEGAVTPTSDDDGVEPEVGAAPASDFRDRWVALGLKVGLYVPSIVNDMGPHVDVGLEGTLLLPFIERRLGVMLEVGWSPPGASGSGEDPRVGEMGGQWTYEMTTQELFFALGPVFRFLPPGSMIVPYLGFLGRLYLLETSVVGTGNGQPFGENTERSTQIGFVVLGGGELHLGPGALLLEISFGYSSLPHTITGDTSTGALAVELGYRLFL